MRSKAYRVEILDKQKFEETKQYCLSSEVETLFSMDSVKHFIGHTLKKANFTVAGAKPLYYAEDKKLGLAYFVFQI